MGKFFSITKLLLLTTTIWTFSVLSVSTGHAAEVKTMSTTSDPHYTDGGFFDVHVCNWPDRPLFFLTLWSTTRYKSLVKVEIFDPKGRKLGELDLNKYRLLKQKNKPDKRVFIKQFEIPKDFGDGIYTAKATFMDKKVYVAKDYVILESMQRATNPYPANNEKNVSVTAIFKWDPVPGAQYYQVFLKDTWKGETIYTSDFLSEPKLKLPKGLLQPDGLYEWRIHARDTNGHTLLGDFNHGSLSENIGFSTAP